VKARVSGFFILENKLGEVAVKGSENKSSKKMKRNKAALLVIDVQRGLFERSTPVYKCEQLLRNIIRLGKLAHKCGVPVVYVQHENLGILRRGSSGWKLHPRLKPLRKDHLIHKKYGNAFQGTGLKEVLIAGEVGTVVITGLATQWCVRDTCLGARRLGYRVILAEDGHSNFGKQAQKNIAEWNRKLRAKKIELKPAAEITFR
jgi:nicotinamidase-related amidase